MTVTEKIVVPTVINGERRTEGSFFKVESPNADSTTEIVARITTKSELTEATTAAKAAQKVWVSYPASKRRDILLKAGALLRQRKDELSTIMQLETGVPPAISGLFTEDAISIVEDLGCLVSTHPEGTISVSGKGRRIYVYREPVGTVLSIAPWNAPSVLCLRSVAGPLAAGCAVVFKTSERSPLTHWKTIEAFFDAGVPDGVINVINAPPEDAPDVVNTLIEAEPVRKINFTGSTQVGKHIAIAAARVIKPVLLELGGKTAVFVDKDADLGQAALNTLIGGWANAGQICMSADRVFVVDEVYDDFAAALKQTATNLLNDSEHSSSPFKSPVIDKNSHDRVQGLVEDAKSGGAKSVFEDGYRYVLGNVSPASQITKHEIFGPALYLTKVSSLEQAISDSNEQEYGLNSAIWTKDNGRGIKLARLMECGTVHVNGNSVFDHGTIPHGGVKSSGYGRFGAQWGIDEFSYTKAITIPED